MKISERTARIQGNQIVLCPDEMLVERRYSLFLDGEHQLFVMMSPSMADLWALGHLRCRRLIESMDDVESIKTGYDTTHVIRRVHRQGYASIQRVIHSGTSAFSEHIPSPETEHEQIHTTPEAIRHGIEWLKEGPLFTATGCAHVAAILTPRGERLFMAEDVGRHNAIDKATGWVVANGITPHSVMLVTSGRLPEDMVVKLSGAGYQIAASVSAATWNGVQAARSLGMTIIGFVRGQNMNVYTGCERIKGLSIPD